MQPSANLRDPRTLVPCGLFASLMCVLAPFSIPLAGGVPISLATFVSMLSGVVLGGPAGALSQLVYLLIGAAGLPVFSGFRGGAGVLLGMTGGYLIGYVVLAWTTGTFYHAAGKGRPPGVRTACLAAGAALGTFALYALGTAWFMFSTGTALGASLTACVLPFLPGDLLKIAAAAAVAPPVEAAVRRAAPQDM